MDSLYERCRNNKLIFTKLRPQTSPDRIDDNQSQKGASRNTELEEIFTRRNSAAATRMTPTRRTPGTYSVDGTEMDSDLDETRSELGSEIYSEAGNVTKRNKKLNRLIDLIQSDKPTSPNSPTEMKKNINPKEPETPNTTLMSSDAPPSSPSIKCSVSNSRVNKLCGSFYWNLVTIISVAFGFVFTELILKQSVKLLQVLKVWIERAGNYMWTNFLATMGTTEGEQKKTTVFGKQWPKPGSATVSVENVLLLAMVVPALLILSVSYAFVWVLYFLNVILLTEIPLF